MATRRGALARWRTHLEEVMGVDDAAEVVDETTQAAGLRGDVARLGSDLHGFRGELRAEVVELRSDIKDLRRDLLRVTGAQFLALIAAVATLVGLG